MKDVELQERFAAVKEVAISAGERALGFFNDRSQLLIEQKGPQDFVSQADKINEEKITQFLLNHFPSDTVFGEEMGGTPSEAVWVIDPIDGTTNFICGIPYFCISIAFVQNNVTKIGVVYDPVANELFSSLEGQGAYCNDIPIQARPCGDLSEAIIGLGYSQRSESTAYAHLIERLLDAGCEYRRFGSAALMLAHAAAGRLDGYYESHLNSWDALAGLLLNQEAGAYVAPFLNKDALIQGNQTLVCSKNIKDPLMQVLTKK